VFANGSVFDGTGPPPAPADVVAESGRILEVAPGLAGDQVVDCTGLPVLPGLFDCHVHVTVAPIGMPDIATPAVLAAVLSGGPTPDEHSRYWYHNCPRCS
jgi:imidazolonepropionase-like amidohydrolase